jgi:hypothetical protein
MRRKIYQKLVAYKPPQYYSRGSKIDHKIYHVSLDKFLKKYPEYLDIPIVFHSGDLKIENGLMYLPLYMVAVV